VYWDRVWVIELVQLFHVAGYWMCEPHPCVRIGIEFELFVVGGAIECVGVFDADFVVDFVGELGCILDDFVDVIELRVFDAFAFGIEFVGYVVHHSFDVVSGDIAVVEFDGIIFERDVVEYCGCLEFECVLCERDAVVEFDGFIEVFRFGVVIVFDGYSAGDVVYGVGSVCVSPVGSVVVHVVCVVV